MLLQDEQYVVKWLSQYGALPKTQITRMLQNQPRPQIKSAELEEADADCGCVERLLHWAGCDG